jgi:hypothetical protein
MAIRALIDRSFIADYHPSPLPSTKTTKMKEET